MNRDIFTQIINGMQPDQHQFALLHRVIVFPSRATEHEDRLRVVAFIRHEVPAVYYTSVLLDLPHQDTLMAVRAARPDVNGIPLREESDASIYLSVYGSFSYLANFGTATPMLNTRLSVVANHVHVDATLPDVSPELRQLARTTMEGSQFQRPAVTAQVEQEDPNQVLGQTTTTFNFATTEEREEQQRQARIRHEGAREAMEVEEEMQESDQEESGRDETSDVQLEGEQDAPARQQAAETSARYMQERLAIEEENAEEGNEIIEDETQVDVQEEEEPTQPPQPQQPSPPPQQPPQQPQQPQQPPQLHQPESRRTGVITRQQLQQGEFQARAETLLNEVAQGLQRLTRSATRARAREREERAERTAKRRKRE